MNLVRPMNRHHLLDTIDNARKTLPEFKEVNSGKITSYIINLERAPERLAHVLPQISSLNFPYEIIPAVDGQKISPEEIEKLACIDAYKYIFKMLPEPGTIGCALSHEKALKQFLLSNSEFAIIFEDDVTFDPRKLSVLAKSLVQKKHKWDIVSFEANHHGHPVSIAELPYDEKLVLYLTNVKHAGAYMINRKTAHKLLKNFFPIEMPFDHYFSRAWKHAIQFCGVEPRLVKQGFGNSQIKTSESQKIKSLFTTIVNFCCNVNSSITQSFYNFFCYLFRWF
ncbi:MAG: glycosyltransferase family 25 protein [Holosporaceae bacterium]|jgi:glycosyl transferase family 25|nr:glycosyltransferase family 25 protein [Holosporaceae bacterium]